MSGGLISITLLCAHTISPIVLILMVRGGISGKNSLGIITLLHEGGLSKGGGGM